jgi:hypothetical protein
MRDLLSYPVLAEIIGVKGIRLSRRRFQTFRKAGLYKYVPKIA